MTVRSAWLLNSPAANPGQTRQDTRLSPVGTMTPVDAMTTRAGVIPGGTGLTLTGTGMTGTISTGRAIVQGTTTQGAYPVTITAAESFTVANGNASLPRIDSVFLVAYDQLYDTSGQTAAAIAYVQGTPASTPTAPTAPATGTAYLKLWDIAVPAGASAGAPITWATALTDRRTYTAAVGGITPDGATAGAYEGQYRDGGTTTGLERYNKTAAAWESRLYLGAAGRVIIGTDVNLYRSAPNVLQTDDSLNVGGSLTVTGGLTVAGIGQWQTAIKTGDTPATNNTLTADPHLTIPVAANAKYVLDGWLDYDGVYGGSGDLKLDWTIPAGATMRWTAFGNSSSDTSQKASTNSVVVGTPLTLGTYGTGGAHNSARPGGYLTTGATAGSVTLKWAQNVANATPTTIYTGTWMRLERIA